MKKNSSKWFTLAAVLSFTAAVFQIVNNHWLISALFFASATCFLAASKKYSKAE